MTFIRLSGVCHQVGEKLELLKKQHSEKLAMKENLRIKSEEMEVKLDRADKLVTGLAGERVRWEERVAVGFTNTPAQACIITQAHNKHLANLH